MWKRNFSNQYFSEELNLLIINRAKQCPNDREREYAICHPDNSFKQYPKGFSLLKEAKLYAESNSADIHEFFQKGYLPVGMKEFQEGAATTAIYSGRGEKEGISYTTIGLTNEAGEVAGAVKKFLRGDFDLEELRRRMKKELGDVLWYVAEIASNLKLNLDSIAFENKVKLEGRKNRKTLIGDGNDR